MGRLVCDLGAYRGVVERVTGGTAWSARVEHRAELHESIYEYTTMHDAQQWVERKLIDLMRQPPSPRSDKI